MSDFRPPTDSVPLSEPTADFKKLLDEFKAASIGESRAVDLMIGSRVYDPSGAIIRIRAARQSIESFVTALIEENKRLREDKERLDWLVEHRATVADFNDAAEDGEPWECVWNDYTNRVVPRQRYAFAATAIEAIDKARSLGTLE